MLGSRYTSIVLALVALRTIFAALTAGHTFRALLSSACSIIAVSHPIAVVIDSVGAIFRSAEIDQGIAFIAVIIC
jgi:hypothetical protein